jgi:hypothetical protein
MAEGDRTPELVFQTCRNPLGDLQIVLGEGPHWDPRTQRILFIGETQTSQSSASHAARLSAPTRHPTGTHAYRGADIPQGLVMEVDPSTHSACVVNLRRGGLGPVRASDPVASGLSAVLCVGSLQIGAVVPRASGGFMVAIEEVWAQSPCRIPSQTHAARRASPRCAARKTPLARSRPSRWMSSATRRATSWATASTTVRHIQSASCAC